VQLNPKDEHTREGFVNFLVESDDPDAALAEIKEAMRMWPNNIFFHYLSGKALVKKNDPDGAIAELQWALHQWENHSWQASCALGSAYELKGDLKAALGHYRTTHRVLSRPYARTLHMDDEQCRTAYERLHSQLKK
jgi:tetratricopeptide (TPR) repeat protein